jgi:hypothetical protein
MQVMRNFLITAGFFGIYFSVFQFLTLLWRKYFIYDRVISGFTDKFFSFITWDLPFWIFCIIAGYCIPYVIESTRKYTWAFILGGMFTLHSLLFTSVHYAQAPQLFDIATHLMWVGASLVLCPVGVFLHYKHKKRRPEQPCVGDGEEHAAPNT